MTIKAGELARLKATEESVFVLSLNTTEGTATVRRATGGQDGIRHEVEDFTLAELETPSESRARIAAEQMELRNLFQKPTGSASV